MCSPLSESPNTINNQIYNTELFQCTHNKMVPSKTNYNKVFKYVEIIDNLYINQFCLRRGQIPCNKGYSLCFAISDICVYRLNKQGKLIPCFTGEHMQQCEEYECNNKFKCPGYYCIPFSYNCDGKWDCPGGHDEYSEICLKERQCINMFHCKSVSNLYLCY